MVEKKFRWIFILVLLISIFTFISPSYSYVGIMGFKLNTNETTAGGTINISSMLVNHNNDIEANIKVIYQLKRVSDLSSFYTSYQNFSFAQYEVKKVSKLIRIPRDIPSGYYDLYMYVYSPSGAPTAMVFKDIKIKGENNAVIFKMPPYLRIFYHFKDGRVLYINSYSNMGRPIPPNSKFFVKFSLEKLGFANVKNFNLKLFLKRTYSNIYDINKMNLLLDNNITLNNSVTNFSIPLVLNKSGTYRLFVNIYKNGVLLASKDVGVVIMGESGTIVNVFNGKDIYKKGDNFNLTVYYVGPADGMTNVTDAYLKVIISQQGKIVKTLTKTIPYLPRNVKSIDFYSKLEQDLTNYKVDVILGKGDKVFDEVVLNYEKLHPQLKLSPTGMIYNPNVKGCLDDGVCTPEEKALGNCLDCIKKTNVVNTKHQTKKTKTLTTNQTSNYNNYIYYTLILLFVVFVIVLILIKISEKRRAKK